VGDFQVATGGGFWVATRGPKGPGKSKLDEHQEEIIALLRNGVPKKRVASKYGSSAVNLYNWILKNQLDVAVRE
jgi:DNA invertase Pin-like site-specific DNA recombinase